MDHYILNKSKREYFSADYLDNLFQEADVKRRYHDLVEKFDQFIEAQWAGDDVVTKQIFSERKLFHDHGEKLVKECFGTTWFSNDDEPDKYGNLRCWMNSVDPEYFVWDKAESLINELSNHGIDYQEALEDFILDQWPVIQTTDVTQDRWEDYVDVSNRIMHSFKINKIHVDDMKW